MYIELHSRSAFSFLEGASLPENLVAACAKLGMPAMALLDRDGVYGSPRFHMAAKKAGIKAHIGAEVNCEYFSNVGVSVHARAATGDNARSSTGEEDARAHISFEFQLPLLVSSRVGYQN